jgi:hypothetical protein
MVSWEPANMGSISQSHVHILDCSKYDDDEMWSLGTKT